MRHILTLGFLIFSLFSTYGQVDTTEFQRARELYGKGEYKGARQILKKIEKANPDFAPGLYYLGLTSHSENDFVTAEKYYILAADKDKTYGEPYSDLSALRFAQQNYPEAIEFARLSIERDSTNAKAYINLASALNQIGDYSSSRENFIIAAKINPWEVLRLGDAMLRQYQHYQGAIYYFTIVYNEYPNLPLAVLNLGNTYRTIGETEPALRIFSNGYNIIDPKDEMFGVIYSSYFRLLFDDKQYEQIIETAFDKVPRDYISAYFFTSLSYFGLDKLDLFEEAAIKYFNLRGEKTPDNLEVWAKTNFK